MTIRKAIMAVAVMVGGLTALASAAAAQTRAPDGATIYRQRCAACHGPDAQGRPNLGPALVGVVGRSAAAMPFKYSAPLTKSGLTWTRANLDRYVAAPQKMVRGTRMTVTLPDAAQRKALIDFLSTRR